MFPPPWGIFPPRHMMTKVALPEDGGHGKGCTLTVTWWRCLMYLAAVVRHREKSQAID